MDAVSDGKTNGQVKDMHVKINHLCKSWGAFSLKDITFEIEEGKCFVFLGPCGSGKTLLLSAITGIYCPDSGSIFIGEEDVTSLPPEKRNIGYLFQGGFLFPHLSVKENIYYGLRYRKPDNHYIEMIFGLLGIEEKLLSRKDVINLSGGEARKVALARSLVVKPALLLLDEPLAFLDPISQQMVMDSLKSMNKKLGITIIHVTHSSYEARELADKIAVLVDGAIIQTGTAEEIIEHPQDILRERYWGNNV